VNRVTRPREPWRLALVRRLVQGNPGPMRFNRFEELFCEWNAQRRGITLSESRERFRRSAQVIHGGTSDSLFRWFTTTTHSVLSVFADDSPREAADAYIMHAELHFLRMLSYSEPDWRGSALVTRLADRPRVTVLDYGCGLAQNSITLAEELRAQGSSVRLVLADFPTIRFEYLDWLLDRLDIDHQLVPVGYGDLPRLEPWDVLVATEFFEHVHDPVGHMRHFHEFAAPNALLYTNVSDHGAEFMHVTPHLGPLRTALSSTGYVEIVPDRVFQRMEPSA
jgi:hypothetical protein